jgi:hypothetical protein
MNTTTYMVMTIDPVGGEQCAEYSNERVALDAYSTLVKEARGQPFAKSRSVLFCRGRAGVYGRASKAYFNQAI